MRLKTHIRRSVNDKTDSFVHGLPDTNYRYLSVFDILANKKFPILVEILIMKTF